MGVTTSRDASTATGGTTREMIPPWVYTVRVPPEFAGDKIGSCSDGMSHLGPNTVTRFRTGHFDTDGARWERGFSTGKHTFEIVFPAAHRGLVASVGVCTEEAPLHVKGKACLAGANKFSWGICLRSRRSYHKGAIVKKFPASQAYLPDKFYMYLDADSGTLQFGSDLDYYGAAINNIPRQQPLYPMVAASEQGSTITMVYRGRGSTENVVAVGGPVVAVVHHQQQPMQPMQPMPPHQQQPPYQQPPPHQQPPPGQGFPPPYSEGEKQGPPPAEGEEDKKGGPPPPADY